MNLIDLIHRQPVAEPWAEGEKIPWNEPGFSRRMLKEHLSQAHDAASRRFALIDRHVAWIHHTLLAGRQTRVLDLGCGPGLYASRLARLGHECLGIDFSPASIAYARAEAPAEPFLCAYREQDIRTAEYGSGFGLVMSIYGELNVFTPADARLILRKAHQALDPGGWLLLEPHTFSGVRRLGEQPATWYAAESGLFLDRPHLCLQESFWDAQRRVATRRYFIVEAATGQVTRHASSTQAYELDDYRAMIVESGFRNFEHHAALGEEAQGGQNDLQVIVAQK